MVECEGDLWTYRPVEAKVNARVIATNGVVKSDGAAVMGVGSASGAQVRYPGIDRLLGKELRRKGNRVHWFEGRKWWDVDFDLITFPTKSDWRENSTLELITRSAVQLVDLTDKHPEWQVVLMPRVGCGAGNLKWIDVKRRISGLLDDRFFVITYPVDDSRLR